MRLLRVLEGIRCRHMRGAHDGIEVLDVAYDSRRATPGCLFVCIPGPPRTDTTSRPTP